MTISSVRNRLEETLFRDPPEPAADRERVPALVIGAGLFTLAILLQLLRVGWSSSLHSFWAEDGAVYFSGAVHSDLGGSLFDTYATYLVFVPRALGEAAALFPLADAPAALSILAAAVVALSGLVVWQATAGLIESPWLRGGLALATVLAPVGGLESTASAAYVPWYMLFATFWILLWRPASWAGALGAGLFALATGLSTPGVWFFVPLALLRTLALRDRRDGLLLAGFWTGAAVQVPVLALNEETAVTPLWTQDIWTAYLQRVVEGAALGLRIGGQAWAHLGWPFLIAFALLAVAVVGYGLYRANFTARLLALVAIPTSLAMFVVSVYQRAVGTEMVWLEGGYVDAAGRYAIVPALLLLSVAAVLVDRRARRQGERERPRLLAPALLALIVVAVIGSFNVANEEARGTPPWRTALEQGAATCAVEGQSETGVSTSPPGWGLNVPCADLAPFATAPRR